MYVLLNLIVWIIIIRTARYVVEKNNSKEIGTEPNILKPAIPTKLFMVFSVLGFLFIIVTIIMECKNVNQSKDNILAFVITDVMTGLISIYLFCYGLYGLLWEVEILDANIIYSSILKKKKSYMYSEITRLIKTSSGMIKVYGKKECLFTIGKEVNPLEFEMKCKEQNIPIYDETLKKGEYICRPYLYLPIVYGTSAVLMGSVCLYSVLQKEPAIYIVILIVLTVIFAFSTLKLGISKTIFKENDVMQYAFLKKHIAISYDDISYIQELETKNGKEIIINTHESEKKIVIEGSNKGVENLREYAKEKGIKWKHSTTQNAKR